MQTFIYCKVTLHVSGVTAPIIRSTKTVTSTSGIGHNTGTATSFQRSTLEGSWTFLLTLNHDARNHEFNPLNPELNPICYLLALLAHHFLHVSRIRVNELTLRLLMSYIYIYMENIFLMFLDHTQRRSTVGRTPLDE